MNDPKAYAAYHPQQPGEPMANHVEWQASVAYQNSAGQSERTHGYGTTREEALADARQQPRMLTTTQEIGHVCSWRDVGAWHTENPTYEENQQ